MRLLVDDTHRENDFLICAVNILNGKRILHFDRQALAALCQNFFCAICGAGKESGLVKERYRRRKETFRERKVAFQLNAVIFRSGSAFEYQCAVLNIFNVGIKYKVIAFVNSEADAVVIGIRIRAFNPSRALNSQNRAIFGNRRNEPRETISGLPEHGGRAL